MDNATQATTEHISTTETTNGQSSTEHMVLGMLAQYLERLERIEQLLVMRSATKEPEILLDTPRFMEVAGIGETKAWEIFKNKELARRGILVKSNSPSSGAGWLLKYEK